MSPKKIVVIGAAGYVAGLMLPALRAQYDLTLLDVKTTTRDGDAVKGVQIADLENPDRDAYRAHFQGADAVVHCGFKGTVAWQHTDYWKESDNIRMCYNVYQTCIEEGVNRIVVMSSNHACDFYERLIWSDQLDFATTDMLPLSDNFTAGPNPPTNTSPSCLQPATPPMASGWKASTSASARPATPSWKGNPPTT